MLWSVLLGFSFGWKRRGGEFWGGKIEGKRFGWKNIGDLLLFVFRGVENS